MCLCYFTFLLTEPFCAVQLCSPGSWELWTWLNNPSKKLKKDFAVFIRDQKKRKGMEEVYNEGKKTMNQVFFPGPGSLNHVPSRCFPAFLIRFLEIKDISRCRYHLDERFRVLSHFLTLVIVRQHQLLCNITKTLRFSIVCHRGLPYIFQDKSCLFRVG